MTGWLPPLHDRPHSGMNVISRRHHLHHLDFCKSFPLPDQYGNSEIWAPHLVGYGTLQPIPPLKTPNFKWELLRALGVAIRDLELSWAMHLEAPALERALDDSKALKAPRLRRRPPLSRGVSGATALCAAACSNNKWTCRRRPSLSRPLRRRRPAAASRAGRTTTSTSTCSRRLCRRAPRATLCPPLPAARAFDGRG